jgi:hypothetical protein
VIRANITDTVRIVVIASIIFVLRLSIDYDWCLQF